MTVVYSAAWKEHLQHLEMDFKHLKEENLKIKLNKCQFFKKAPSLLRSSYIYGGYSAIMRKVSAIKKFRKPSNIDELHHFLGLTGYYRKFIPLFTNVTKPLNKLLKKNTKFQWLPHCQTAFKHLKASTL